jgi:hypothetical protein
MRAQCCAQTLGWEYKKCTGKKALLSLRHKSNHSFYSQLKMGLFFCGLFYDSVSSLNLHSRIHICLLVWWHSCTPTKSNLLWYFFHNCHEWTCPIQTSYIPCTKSHIHFLRLGCLCKKSVQVRSPLQHFVISLFSTVRSYPHAKPLSWRTTPCRLSATAYSIYLQLPSISGAHLLHPHPEDVLCCGDKGPV